MKKILSVLILIVGFYLFGSPTKAFAANLYWVGANGANTSVNTNWKTTDPASCGGGNASAAPTTNDVAIFDADCDNNANINSALSVDGTGGITLSTGYSGTVTQAATITVGTTGWTQTAGTFSGGSQAITIGSTGTGNWSVTGGSFTSTSGTLTAGASVTLTGTFVHNSGSVVWDNPNASTPTINASVTFNNFDVGTNATTAGVTYTFTNGTTTTVNGNLGFRHAGSGNPCLLAGTGGIVAKVNITATGFGCGNGTTSATVIVTINGTVDQIIAGEADADTTVPGITINKASGNLTITNEIAVTDNWTYTSMGSGSFIVTGSTVMFSLANARTDQTITGSTTFNNLEFRNAVFGGAGFTSTVSSGTTLTVSGNLNMTNSSNPVSVNGTGTIAVAGNITTGTNGATGTVPITLNGTGTQTITASGSSFPTGTVTFNKASGSIVLATNWFINQSGQDLLVQSGSSQTVTGAFQLDVNDQFTISGTLIQGTTFLSVGTIGTFTVSSGGVWSNTSTGDVKVGVGTDGIVNSGTIIFDGTSGACGEADAISFTTSGGASGAWRGSGGFYLSDVSLQDQTTSLGLTAYSSTNVSGNTGFTFYSTCPANPIGYWEFNEGQGTTANDSSNSRANGTLSGTTVPAWKTEDLCIQGKCLYFDGSTSYVSTVVALPNVKTVGMWVRPNSVSSSALIDLDGGTHTITVSSGTITANGFSSPTYYVNGIAGNRTLTANTWNYVEVTTSTSFNSGGITIGKSSSTYLQGFIDEVRVFNTERSASDVRSDYVSRGGRGLGVSQQISNTPNNNPNALSNGLVGSWKMDESSWVTGSAGSTPAYVRTTGQITGADVANASTSFSVLPAVGNHVIVMAAIWNDPQPTSVTFSDNQGNSYTTNISKQENLSGSSGAIVAIGSAKVINSSGTFTVQVATNVGSGNYIEGVANEYSGLASSSWLDQTGNNKWAAAANAATVTADGANTQANELVIAAMDLDGTTSNAHVTTPTTSYFERGVNQNINNTIGFEAADKVVSSIETSSAAWNHDSLRGAAVIATYKGTAAVATVNATDSSGNGNAGTPGGGATPASGKFGNGGSFDGTDDYVEVTDANSLDATNVTLSAWINPTALGGAIIAKATGAAGTDGYLLDTSGSKIRFCATGGCVSSTTTLSTSTWQYITVAFDGTTVRFYLNGVLDGTSTGTVTSVATNAVNLRMGTDSATGSDYNGKIDEARVYTRALSGAEVSQLYNFAPGPVGYWKFDENSGTSANDSSGNGNTGTWGGTGTYWQPGKYGQAGKFTSSGSDTVTVASNSSFAVTSGLSFGFWYYVPSNSGVNEGLFRRDLFNPSAYGCYKNGSFTISCSITNSAGTNVNAPDYAAVANQWVHIFITWDGANIKLYANGVLQSTTAQTGSLSTNSSSVTIGGISGAYLTGALDEVKLYNYARTAGQVVEDMNAGHPPPGSPVGTPLGYWKFDQGADNTCSGGTNDACNSGSQGSLLDGAQSNMAVPATATSGWTQSGKFGKALVFDNSNDVINSGSDGSIDNLTANPMSLSAWIYPNTIGEGNQGVIMAKNVGATPSAGWLWQLTATNTLKFSVDGSTDLVVTASNSKITLGAWNHVALTWDGVFTTASSVHMYVNGVEVSYQTQTNGATIVSDASSSLFIGNDSTGASTFDGTIDEPKVYGQQLTADQVKVDMNQGQAQVTGALSDKSTYQPQAANQEYCVPGDSTSCAAPVGRWDMEEGTGTTTNDTSGNGFNGTFVGTTGSQWTNGKNSKALKFNGTNNSVDITDNATLRPGNGSWSVELWANPPNTSAVYPLITKRLITGNLTQWSLWICGGSASGGCAASGKQFAGFFIGAVGSTDYRTETVADVADGKWHHFAMVADKANSKIRLYVDGIEQVGAAITTSNTGAWPTLSNTDNVRIGSNNNAAWYSGSADNVRIFNYARTSAQIAWDYNKGGAATWYKFDECQGSTLNDSSGLGRSGSIVMQATGTQTAVGTCAAGGSTAWGNGAVGKRNYALSLDADDYAGGNALSYTESTSQVSWAMWLKPTTLGASKCILCKGIGAGGLSTENWLIGTNSTSGDVFVDISLNTNDVTGLGLTPTGVLTNGVWTHLVVVYDGTLSGNANRLKVYANGVQQTLTFPSSNIPATTTSATTGTIINATSLAAAFFNGVFDDMRIFSYSITPTQVKTIYNDGAYRTGPVTGAP